MASHRKLTTLVMALAAGATVLAPAATALAQSYYDNDGARGDYSAQRYYDNNQARRDYDARYGEGAYDRYYGAQADTTYREDRRECRNKKNGNTAAGAILGGIAGAVIGSNLAHGGGREGGAIIGGVAGAAGGSAIARGTVHCDDQ